MILFYYKQQKFNGVERDNPVICFHSTMVVPEPCKLGMVVQINLEAFANAKCVRSLPMQETGRNIYPSFVVNLR